MKILKKLLLVGLFSFVFLVNANALTSDYYSELKYSDELMNLVENNQNKIDLIVNYAKTNGVWGQPFNGKYIIAINMQTINSNNIEVRFIDMGLNRFDDFFSIDNRYGDGYIYSSFGFSYFGFYESYTISNDVITSSRQWQGEFSFVYYYPDYNCDPTQENCLITIDNYYFYTDLLDEQYKTLNIQFNELSSTTNIPLKFNDEIYTQPIEFNLYNFLNSFSISSKSYYDKGIYEDSEVISYKIKDEEVGNDKELSIRFTFEGVLDITNEDIEIYKYGSQVYTQHNMSCSNIESNSVCEFKLKYDVYESIDDKILFDFKFNNKYDVKIEDTSGNNGIYSNHKDVEFDIKILNLTEKSGGVFYLRNYDNYEYLSSFYEEDYFGFSLYSSHPSNIKFDKVIYPNAIQYKNNYIYKGSDNFYHFDSGSYSNINNFGYFSVPFVFDSNLLLESKYSSFVIRNRNYLGSSDLDNQDLYISYNSSLFNINILESSSIVEDGVVDNFIGTNIDFNFTVNGSQNSFEVGVIIGERFEFDKDIKVTYNNGFEYFKDKIIDMFEFVSDFYNTMPQKFRITFSFIFVLLIGIALFRLLL